MHSTSLHQRVPLSPRLPATSVCPLPSFPQTRPAASVKIHPSIIGYKGLPRNSVPLWQLSVLPSSSRFGDVPVYHVVIHTCGSVASLLSQLGSALQIAPRVDCYVAHPPSA